MQEKTLLSMLSNPHNNYVSDDKLSSYAALKNNLIISLGCLVIFGGIISTLLLSNRPLNLYINYNEYTSLLIGNLFYIFAFKLLKNKLFFYWANNPLTIIGLVYPAFFNARILSLLSAQFLNQSTHLYGLFVIVSVIVYYLILSTYYTKVVNQDDAE